MDKVTFTISALDEYEQWKQDDKKIHKKILTLIKATLREPYEGIGKPEPLKANLSGYYSRRINKEHRLVYCFENNSMVIISCKGHYEDS